MAEEAAPTGEPPVAPSTLEELQHWTWVIGRAQQMMMEHGLTALEATPPPPLPAMPGMVDPA